jgi:hypothetical protein
MGVGSFREWEGAVNHWTHLPRFEERPDLCLKFGGDGAFLSNRARTKRRAGDVDASLHHPREI